MSIYSRIKSEPPVEEVQKNQTPFYMSNTNEGFECLVFNGEEIYDEGGHTFTFYENGVLLTLKNNCRFHKDCEHHNGSKSFIFYNNNGEKVLDVYNSTREKEPEKDIDVTIYNGFILVKETSFKNNSETEYFVSVKTGKIVPDFGAEEEQTLAP